MQNNCTIYFIRHGQTDWNAEWRLQGQMDIPINDNGRAQAKRNGEKLSEILEDPKQFHYVASPLGRTRETMEIVRGALGLPVKDYDTDDLLKEIHFGDWQHRTWDELRAEVPDLIAARFADPWNTVSPGEGGESYGMLSDRALKWLAGVDRDTIVVSHGGINRCLRGHIENLTHKEIASIKVPQDQVMVIRNGTIDWV